MSNLGQKIGQLIMLVLLLLPFVPQQVHAQGFFCLEEPCDNEDASADPSGADANAADTAADSTGDEGSTQSARPEKQYRIPTIPKPEGLPGLASDNLDNPEDARQYFIGDLLPRVTKLLITLVAIASFVMLLVSGFTYFTTFGDTDKGDKAKNTAIWSLVGLIVAMLSFAIVQVIGSLPFS